MYAVIKTGGKQYRVQSGDILQVEKLKKEKGQKVSFDQVLLIEDEGEPLIGTPFVEDALVKAEVIESFKDKKVIVFKKKRRKQYKKKRGHRQELTRIKIEEIIPSVKKAAAKKPAAVEKKVEKQAAPKKTEVKTAKAKEAASKKPAVKPVKKEEKKGAVTQKKAKTPETKKPKAGTSPPKEKIGKITAKTKKS